MISHDEIDHLIGAKVHGEGGGSLGKVETFYVDDHTDQPTFAVVKVGRLGTRSSFVPLRDATTDDDGLHVPYTKERVAGAPSFDGDDDAYLSPGGEAELHLYYGLPYSQEYGDTLHENPAAAPHPGDDAKGRLRKYVT
ncbi:MAG: PRC-barrel domain-containing protein [Egicoccus sp.]